MSFNNPTDVTHGVEVEADTLYEVEWVSFG